MANVQTAHCMKCKEVQEVDDPVQVKMKNGRAAVRGTCAECGTPTYRIGEMT